MFGTLLSWIDPSEVDAAMTGESNRQTSFWSICRKMFTKEARRALAAAVNLLNIFGAALLKREKSKPSVSVIAH